MEQDEEEILRLLALLKEAVRRSGRSRRDIERSMGVAHGYLGLLFTRRLELRVRHILMLGRELEFEPAAFFHRAYPIPVHAEPGVLGSLWEAPPAASGVNPEEIRAIVRQEFERLTREAAERKSASRSRPPLRKR
ncbi:MAG TPA: hypothetical protein VOA87_03635 [Thermoanaerobaculia bacterium]|nr:hypothetical protein [Thermoanaerobaculia bacterium]